MTFTQNRLSTRLWAFVAVALLAVGITVVGAESAAAKTGTSITMAPLSATSGSKVVMGKNKIKVSGTASANLRGKTLKFQVSTNGGQSWTNIGATAVVKSNSSWSTTIKPPKAGKVTVRARWVGNASLYGTSAVRSINVFKQATSVKFTSFVPGNKERAVSGAKGTLKGVTSSNLKGKYVAILFQTKSGSWKKLGTTKVGSDARFSYSFKVPSNGTVKFRVRYGGDAWRVKDTFDRTVTVWKWYDLFRLDEVSELYTNWSFSRDIENKSGTAIHTVGGVDRRPWLSSPWSSNETAEGFVMYNLKRQCIALNSRLGVSDYSNSDYGQRWQVLADGVTKKTVDFAFQPSSLRNLRSSTVWFSKSTQQLRLEYQGTDAGDGYAMWIQPRLLCTASPLA